MRKIIIPAAIVAAAILAVPAWADRDREEHPAATTTGAATAATTRLSAESMKQKIDALGYDVRRLEMEDGLFAAHLVDRASGGAVKALFHGTTGELVRAAPHE